MIHFTSIFLLFTLFSYSFGLYCPTGFSVVNGQKCVKLFRNSLKHLEAENDCSYFGGTLVTIKNAVDNRAITTLAASSGAQNIWIGMFCFATGNTTMCYHDDNSGIVSYQNFGAGNPMIQGKGGCVYLSTGSKTSGQWFSAPCEIIGLPFICEAPPTFADPSCRHNYNGYCYTISQEQNLTSPTLSFAQAQASCQAIGANLLSIHSKPEIDFVKGLYKDHSEVPDIYLGAQASLPNTFSWVDGSNWDYDNFDPLSGTQSDCLIMELFYGTRDLGLWSQWGCKDQNYFACKRKISAVEPEKLEPKIKNEDAYELLDLSNCNTTLFIAPGVITSFGYPNAKPPASYCTWNLAVLGPYRIGLYFTDFSTYTPVYVYDADGNLVNMAQYNAGQFKILGTTNFLRLVHDSVYDATYSYHGFSATILPY